MEKEKIINELDIDVHNIQTNEFYRIAIELFQFDRNKEETYIQKKKNCLKYYSFCLPDELNNYFIGLKDAPLFFTFETKFLIYLEEFIRFNFPQKTFTDYYKLIKDFFYKWSQAKNPEEKRYFASTILNYHERDPNKNNFLTTFITGIILCFDANVCDIKSGLYLFGRTKQIIDGLKLNERHKKEFLCMIEIYSGFAYLLMMEFEQAKERFNTVLSINPINITSKFYLAYCESRLTYYDITDKLLNEIFDYDVYRLVYAIENNNFQIFNYFINNLLFVNIFEEDIFAENLSTLLNITQIQSNEVRLQPKELLLLLDDLKKIELKNINIEKIKKEVENIEEMLKLNVNSRNITLKKVFPKFINKVKIICESLIESVNTYYSKSIQENLSPFEKDIQEKLNDIGILETELEESKKQAKTRLEGALKNEDTDSSSNIKLIEEKIENISCESKYDPKGTFKSTIIYTIIISFISSILGGSAGYSGLYINSSRELNYILSTIIMNGFKWGIFTFFIGFIISILAASVSIIERANKRQKLVTRIKQIKNRTEIEKQRLQERSQENEKSLISNFNDKTDDIKKRIEDIRQSKKNIEIQLKTETNRQLIEDTEPLRLIIEKFG